jgi:hypothetical protein
MNIRDLNALANDLLTCYLRQSEAAELVKVCQKYGIPVGGKVMNKAVELSISWLDSGDDEFLNETNKQLQFQSAIRGISNKFGAEFGKDFSLAGDGGLIINKELMIKIMDDMPPESQEKFKEMGYIKAHSQDPFKMLEDSLGVPFFTKLEAIVKLRFTTLDDGEVGEYLSYIAQGLQNKHSWIDDAWVGKFFLRTMGENRFQAVCKAQTGAISEGIGVLVLDDLMLALGRTETKYQENGDRLLGLADVLALDKVFRGEEFSFAKLGEQIRRLETKHKKDNS